MGRPHTNLKTTVLFWLRSQLRRVVGSSGRFFWLGLLTELSRWRAVRFVPCDPDRYKVNDLTDIL